MMGRARICFAVLALGSALAVGRGALGQEGHPPAAHPMPAHPMPAHPMPAHPNAPAPAEHAEHAEHADHAEHAEHDESAPPRPINWWHGFLGEKGDVAPSLMWRAPGEPPPFLASFINFAALVAFAVVVGKKPLRQALLKRKETMLREIEDAQRMRKAAQKRLAEYEAKLAKMHEELERVRREFLEQGERDKARIVREARERQERLKKDAELLLSQEAKQMRQDLVIEVVQEATRLAGALLAQQMTVRDHEKFAESFLDHLHSQAKPRALGVAAPSVAPKGAAS